MSYQVHNFQPGDVLLASQLNEMDNQIAQNIDSSNIASEFSASSTYAVGDYVIYEGQLYQCTTAVTTAGSWNSSNWTQAVLGNDVSELKSAMDYKLDSPTNGEIITYSPELSKTLNGNGVITALSSTDDKWRVTGYIPVQPGERYEIIANALKNYSYYAFYDNSYNPIFNQKASGSEIPNTFSGIVSVPIGATYMCIAFYVAPTAYNPLIKLLVTESVNIKDVKSLSGNYEYIKESVSYSLTTNKSINRTTGQIATPGSSKWAITNDIPVQEGEEYIINTTMFYNNGVIAIYDSSDNVLDIVRVNAVTPVSSNVYRFENYYYRISSANATKMIIGTYTDYAFSVEKITGYSLIAKTYPWNGKKWACVGDSLTNGSSRTSKYYYDYVAETTGIEPYNMGDSGSGYAKEQDGGTAFYQRISSIPLDSDVVTIFGSFNDLSSGLDLGSKTDTGTSTIGGCINTTLDNLFTAFPLANVGVVTPTPWNTANPLSEPNTASNYVALIKDICLMRGIPCLDLFHCSQLRPWEASYRETVYSKDGGNGVHPNEIGHKIIAPQFEAFLDSLLLH